MPKERCCRKARTAGIQSFFVGAGHLFAPADLADEHWVADTSAVSAAFRTRSVFLPCALAIAMVYQLGAGACGCLEHNGWYQAVVAMASDADSQTVPLEEPRSPLVDEDHCDRDAHPPALVASKAHQLKHPACVALSVCSVHAASDSASAVRSGWPVSHGKAAAQPVRASLQVFLL